MPSTAPTCAQQLGEQRAARRARNRDVAAVRVHVLAEERDLDDAAPRRGPAPRPGCRRSSGIAAGPGRAARCRTCRRCRTPARSTPTRGTRRRAPPAARWGRPPCTRGRPSAGRRSSDGVQQLEQVRQGVRADHDVDPRRAPLDLALVLLREAPRHHDAQRRVVVLQRLQVAEVAVQPVVGVLADRARVEHHDLGARRRRRSASCRRPSSRPAIRSESCSFIWHPKVRIRYVRSIASRLPPTWRTPPPASRARP